MHLNDPEVPPHQHWSMEKSSSMKWIPGAKRGLGPSAGVI